MTEKTKQKTHAIPPCKCCGKQWTKDDEKEYRYIADILACRSHCGVDEWYIETKNKQNNKKEH